MKIKSFIDWYFEKSFWKKVYLMSLCIGLGVFFYMSISCAIFAIQHKEYRLRHHFARQSWYRHYSPSLDLWIRGNARDNSVTIEWGGENSGRVQLFGANYEKLIFIGYDKSENKWLILSPKETYELKTYKDKEEWIANVQSLGLSDTELLKTREVFRKLPDMPSPYAVIIEDIVIFGGCNFVLYFLLSLPFSALIVYVIGKLRKPKSQTNGYVSVLFSDVLPYDLPSTNVISSEEQVKIRSYYFDKMSNIIKQFDGHPNPLHNEGISAIFGTLTKTKRHAVNACGAAIEMLAEQSRINKGYECKNSPEDIYKLHTVIGINTGYLTLQQSQRRVNGKKSNSYSAIGNNVNFAARAQAGCRAYGVSIMTGDETKQSVEEVSDTIVFRYLDTLFIKGQDGHHGLFEVYDYKEKMTDADLKCVELFEEGIEYYKQQNWDDAEKLFQQSAEYERFQTDSEYGYRYNPSTIYIKRVQDMRNNPPPKEWAGAYMPKSKQ